MKEYTITLRVIRMVVRDISVPDEYKKKDIDFLAEKLAAQEKAMLIFNKDDAVDVHIVSIKPKDL